MARGQNIVGNAARLLFQNLQTVFNVYEEGGTFVQTKDTVTNEYIPDRRRTPLVLRPSFFVKDPSHFIEDGDKTNELSVTWKYDGSVVTSTDDTQGDNVYLSGKNLVIKTNLIKQSVPVTLDATYTDKRKGNVLKFHREWNFTLQPATQQTISMSIDQPPVIRLSPFNWYGFVTITCQLFEGPAAIDDDQCVYTWQYKKDGVWTDITSTPTADTLFVNAVNGKSITIDQAYTQFVELRCKGVVKNLSSNSIYDQYCTVRLYRYYGDVQKPVVLPIQGSIITLDTRTIASKLYMKYSGGDIKDEDVPKNFSIYWYYKNGISSNNWLPLPDYDCTSASMTIDPSSLKNGDYFYDGVALGAETYPLTAMIPVKLGGKVLTIGGKFITAQTEITE